MNWGDERYVRVYTRDTTDYLMWSWQAQALWWQILRKFTRAGVLELGRHGLKGICAHIKMPWDIAGPALDELLEDGCIALRQGAKGSSYLFATNYVDANEAVQSDKCRQQAVRERRKDLERLDELNGKAADNDVTARDAGVTAREETSRRVTPGHDESRAVTPCLPSVPSVPDRTDQDPPASPSTLVPLDPPGERFDFESVYRDYPRKENKAPGMKTLAGTITSTSAFESFRSTVAKYMARERVKGTAVKYYKTWSTLANQWRGMVGELAESSNTTAIAPAVKSLPAFSPEWAQNFNLAAKERDMLERGETPPWWALPRRWAMTVDHGGSPLIPVRDGKAAEVRA